YALEASGNLVDWRVVAAFTATNFISTWMDSHTASKHFYRLRDDTGFYAFSGRVLDSNTGLPIAGAEIYSPYDGSTTFTDNNGLFYLKTSVPTSWYFWSGYQLGISAVGYAASEDYYYGSGLVSGLQIYLAP
ncbi:MAG: hypothetical protein KGJ60_01320, partial [Verrucomicrobiota bacterium]|nr:hypothetical protein [Verrucomicrobiota bacterium]